MKVIVTANKFQWRDDTQNGRLHVHHIREVIEVPKEVYERNTQKLKPYRAAMGAIDKPFPHSDTQLQRGSAATRSKQGGRT